MGCYVDTPRWMRKDVPSGHLVADSVDELHAMAEVIGIERHWFQGHAIIIHYTLLASFRDAAIAAGATALDQKDWGRKIQQIYASRLPRTQGPEPLPRRQRPRQSEQRDLI